MKETYLLQLRDRALPMSSFRKAALSLSEIIASEIFNSIRNSPQKVVLVPILRAGLVFLSEFQKKFERAPIGFLGIRRDEKTAEPMLYYENLPSIASEDQVLVLEPMLATGGSACLALQILKKKGARNFILVTILGAEPGVKVLKETHPEVQLYSVAIDKELDAKKFIVPGLGDFGDRYFGTN